MNINEKIDRLIDLTARVESGGRYDAWNPDDNGAGVSWGLIQFNQKRGSLPDLLRRMKDADPGVFRDCFLRVLPPSLDAELIRRADLSGARAAFTEAGNHEPFQACQRQLAREEYFDPAWRALQRIQNAGRPILVSARAAALAFDIAVQYGVGGLGEKLRKAVDLAGSICTEKAILGKLADLADTHEYDANRRHKLLQSPELSDAPLFDAPAPTETRPTLRRGDSRREVADLRQALGLLHEAGIDSIYRFDKALAVAVADFQRAHGLAVDSVVGPATWAAIDQAARKETP